MLDLVEAITLCLFAGFREFFYIAFTLSKAHFDGKQFNDKSQVRYSKTSTHNSSFDPAQLSGYISNQVTAGSRPQITATELLFSVVIYAAASLLCKAALFPKRQYVAL